MRVFLAVIGTALALDGSAMAFARADAPMLTPQQAVMMAAESPAGVHGTFNLIVKAYGRDGSRHLYLNSEKDYRDPRNLSVYISNDVYRKLSEKFGKDPEKLLFQKNIAVRGTARKTRINFSYNGKMTDKYYYQTHIVLRYVNDLSIGDGQVFE